MNIITKNINPSKLNYLEGAVILIDKPLEWTSFDVVSKLRSAISRFHDVKKTKAGHNGTLDPLATGLLMIFTGKHTKLIPNEENHDKTYEGIIKLGATTVSLDTEMPEIEFSSFSHVNKAKIENAMQSFIGESEQEIPIFSASKVDGKRMYKLARSGKSIEKKFKKVIFNEIQLKAYDAPFIHFNLICGKGTYVRAFARDLGIKLQTTGYLYALRRTAISNYSVKNAFDIHEFCEKLKS